MNQNEVLIIESILTEQSFSSREEATIMAGEILFKNGYVEKEYIHSMLEKNEKHPYATYVGNGLAIPHGMADGSKFVMHTGISVIQVPEGILWNEEMAYFIVGIAANSDDHMGVMSALSDALEDEEDAEKLCKETSAENIYNLLSANL